MISKHSWFSVSLFLLVACAGIYLRLDQYLTQVLLDDEWHAVHQLLAKGPRELFLTIGYADFSIPLSLLYWVEKEFFGLSEIGMRWPMMVAGIVTLAAMPAYVNRYVETRTTLLFTVLLAISPVLVFYARMARPYALTLLLALMALAAFRRFDETDASPWKPALVYLLCAVSCAWLHLISMPLVLVPFVTTGIAALFARNWGRVVRIFWLGLATLSGLLLLVLPPLLNNPEALTGKLGAGIPTLQTYYGVLFVWLGTSSATVVFAGLILAVLGAGMVWREFPLTRTLLVGLGLTCLAILLAQPAWVHHPQTFARYLLPALVLFLLAVACGVSRLSTLIEGHFAKHGKYVFSVLAIALLMPMVVYSPMQTALAKPNSNSLHSVFRFDFREQENLIIRYQKDFPVSAFWEQLAEFEPDTVKIAVAPFSFETNHWDAVRWEQISRQRVMPGYLTGSCVDHRWGEVPAGQGYSFRNTGYLADRQDLDARGFDLVVYQKPSTVMTYQGERAFGADTAACEQVLRESYPVPVYEDDLLVAFPVLNGWAGLPDTP